MPTATTTLMPARCDEFQSHFADRRAFVVSAVAVVVVAAVVAAGEVPEFRVSGLGAAAAAAAGEAPYVPRNNAIFFAGITKME